MSPAMDIDHKFLKHLIKRWESEVVEFKSQIGKSPDKGFCQLLRRRIEFEAL